jgi:hypothetical protein
MTRVRLTLSFILFQLCFRWTILLFWRIETFRTRESLYDRLSKEFEEYSAGSFVECFLTFPEFHEH